MGATSHSQKDRLTIADESLKTELAYFDELRGELLKANEGRFAVIHGRELAGCWDTYRDAVQIGYDRFAMKPFLVKRVLAVDPVQHIFSLSEESISRKAAAA